MGGSACDSYTTVSGLAEAEVNEKKSRFIAAIAPVNTEDEALAFLEGVRAEHRMARHHVFVYVLREDSRVRYSDDGEPARTAGLPVLEVVRYAGLTDVIVVVTRYFGGTLLGTGGLVRAYTQAAQAAIEAAQLVVMSWCVNLELRIPYADYERAVRIAELGGAKLLGSDFSDVVCLQLRVLAAKWGGAGELELQSKLAELLRGADGLTVSEPFIAEF